MIEFHDIKIYGRVWIMHGNLPREQMVFAKVESMDFSKRGVEHHVHLVESQCGAGWGNNEGIQRSIDNIFLTKEELLASL